MGSLPYTKHWERIVQPSVSEFLNAEEWLVETWRANDSAALEDAGYELLRRAMTAALFLHHFTDVVIERGAFGGEPSILGARSTLSMSTVSADGQARRDDVRILKEVADAIKHAELDSPHIVHVAKRGKVLEISENVPLIFAEGRTDGAPEVVIATRRGFRSLRALIQNISRGWESLLPLTQL